MIEPHVPPPEPFTQSNPVGDVDEDLKKDPTAPAGILVSPFDELNTANWLDVPVPVIGFVSIV